MSLLFQGSGGSFVAGWWWEQAPPPGRRVEIADRMAARACLARLGAPAGETARLRRLAAEQIAVMVAGLDDAEVLDRLAVSLATGQLRLFALPREVLAGLDGAAHEEAARAPERAAPRSPPPAAPPPEEEATFAPGIDPELIAAILKDAARSGVPFCEECLKRKLLAKAAEPGTFPEDLDAIAAAAVMSAAAEAGVPFCEVCMKKRLHDARAAQGKPS